MKVKFTKDVPLVKEGQEAVLDPDIPAPEGNVTVWIVKDGTVLPVAVPKDSITA